jgi:hypothetical protein
MPRQTKYTVLMIRLDKECCRECCGTNCKCSANARSQPKGFDTGFEWASCKVITLNSAHRQAKCGWLGSHSAHHRASRSQTLDLESKDSSCTISEI